MGLRADNKETVWEKFESLLSECVAILKSVVELPVGVSLRAKAELSGNHCSLSLLGDRQLVKTDDCVLAALVTTKADDDNFV